jgi:hypothetical protein
MKGKPGCAGRLVDEYTGVVEDIQMFSTTPVFYWSRDNGGPFIVTGPNKRMQILIPVVRREKQFSLDID